MDNKAFDEYTSGNGMDDEADDENTGSGGMDNNPDDEDANTASKPVDVPLERNNALLESKIGVGK
jgi:hypothetical protein